MGAENGGTSASGDSGGSSRIEEEFSPSIGLPGAVAIGVGTMMAAGIFVLSGLAVSNVGTVAVVSFGAAALVASITAGAYGEFSSIYQESGGGYMYVAKTFDTDLTYIMGWTMILGYPASAAFYLASFSKWFAEFLYPVFSIPGATPYWAPGIAILALLVGLNVKGTEESAKFQIAVTAIKVLLVALFIYGGLQTFNADVVTTSFNEHITHFAQIGVTSALVFITFFGFSAIATNAEETKDPGYTIPRAIYLSMGIVTVVYALVVMVIVLAINDNAFLQFLAENAPAVARAAGAPSYIANHGEVAMAYAAQYYLGEIGFYVIIVGALFSMVSAANATILAGSRVKLALARRGHLPTGFEDLSEAGTPYRSVFLTGGFIFIYLVLFTVVFGEAYSLFGVHLGIEGVTQFANALLISGLSVVNVALIFSRRKFPDIDRGFRVPFVPWLPILGVLANLVLLVNVGLLALFIALVAEAVGVVLWFAVISKTDEAEFEEETPTVVAEHNAVDREYQLLVPIANPENVEQLMRTATDVASDENGEILVLSVVTLPEQTPLHEGRGRTDEEREVLERAMEFADDADVPVSGAIRIGHDADQAILNTAEQYDSDAILLGWRGRRYKRSDVVLGTTVDNVVTEAGCDVLVEKFGEAPGEAVDSILLPTAGGPHAELAAETAGAIGRTTGATVRVVHVVDPGSDDREDAEAVLENTASVLENDLSVEMELVEGDDVADVIVEETRDHDVTVIGATREGVLQQLVFGAIPETVGDRGENALIMAKRDQGLTSRLRRWLAWR